MHCFACLVRNINLSRYWQLIQSPTARFPSITFYWDHIPLGIHMGRFKSTRQAQRFLQAHASVYNLFNLGRHLIKAAYYRNLRMSAFSQWAEVVAWYQFADNWRSAEVNLAILDFVLLPSLLIIGNDVGYRVPEVKIHGHW